MPRPSKFFAAALAVAVLIAPVQPAASYDLKPIVVQLSPSGAGSSQTMVITNTHEVPIAIEVQAFVRHQLPNGEDELTPEDEDLIIYPPQMVIPPQSSQSFKVQWVGDQAIDQERAYRIVTEQLPIKFEEQVAGDRTADLTVRYRYEAALYIVPKGAKPSARLISVESVKAEDGSAMLEVTIASEGTLRAILNTPKLDLTTASGEKLSLAGEDIKPLDGLNILPGGQRTVRIPAPVGLASGPLSGTLQTQYVVLQ